MWLIFFAIFFYILDFAMFLDKWEYWDKIFTLEI
jgi:hypothetical protein